MAMDGSYYREGLRIMRSPIKVKNADRSSTISMGFPVCDVSEFAGESGAEIILAVLNEHARGDVDVEVST